MIIHRLTLLVTGLLLVSSAVAAEGAKRTPTRRQAIADLKRLGVEVYCAENAPEAMAGRPVPTSIVWRGYERSDPASVVADILPLIGFFPETTDLRIDNVPLRDDQLAFLKQLSQLERLRLSDAAATDAGYSSLAGLTRLVSLDLLGARINDQGLERLWTLVALKDLDIRGTEVSDDAIERLSAHLPQTHIESPVCPTTEGPAEAVWGEVVGGLQLGVEPRTRDGALRCFVRNSSDHTIELFPEFEATEVLVQSGGTIDRSQVPFAFARCSGPNSFEFKRLKVGAVVAGAEHCSFAIPIAATNRLSGRTVQIETRIFGADYQLLSTPSFVVDAASVNRALLAIVPVICSGVGLGLWYRRRHNSRFMATNQNDDNSA